MRKFFAVIIFIAATVAMWASFHNIDLAWNIGNAPQCMDYNGIIWQSKDEMYLNGLNGVKASFMMFFLSFVILIIPHPRVKKTLNLRSAQ